jgi:tetratricopeptide (TPR) repeat protein
MILKMRFNSIKLVLYLLAFMVLPLFSFGNAQTDVLFEKANASYAKGQYKEALSGYQEILNSGYESPAIYFNMGNASYKTDDIPSALLYYEKARKLSPGDEDINFNIVFANTRTADKIEEMPDFFLGRWMKSLVLSYPADTLGVVSLLSVLLGSALLILYFFAHSVPVKKSSFYAAILLFFLGISAVFMANRQISYFDDHRQGIVFSSPVTVKSAPNDKSRALFVIHDGTKVNILESNDSWIRIRLANGNEGWMKIADLKEI